VRVRRPRTCDSLTRPEERLARRTRVRHAVAVAEPVLYREEVVGLLFTVNDMSEALREIRDVLVEEDDGEEEDDEG
jgi:hypothetical protein